MSLVDMSARLFSFALAAMAFVLRYGNQFLRFLFLYLFEAFLRLGILLVAEEVKSKLNGIRIGRKVTLTFAAVELEAEFQDIGFEFGDLAVFLTEKIHEFFLRQGLQICALRRFHRK